MAKAHRLNQNHLNQQLKRLRSVMCVSNLAFEELKRVVNSHAASDEHVGRIVDAIIDTRRPNEEGFVACPTPAEMADYCLNTPKSTKTGMGSADLDCNLCRGGGSIWRKGTTPFTSGNFYEFTCPCRMPKAKVPA